MNYQNSFEAYELRRFLSTSFDFHIRGVVKSFSRAIGKEESTCVLDSLRDIGASGLRFCSAGFSDWTLNHDGLCVCLEN